MNIKRETLVRMITAAATAVAGFWFLTTVGQIPPDRLMQINMSGLHERIDAYAIAHNKLPAQLSDLPPPASDHADCTHDGWHRPIVHISQSDGSFVLKSSGPDGKGNIAIYYKAH